MPAIERIRAREVLDSRGNPTVEAEVVLADGALGRAIAPSGASTGEHEALELRDADADRFGGRGVLLAIRNVEEVIAPAVAGIEGLDQRRVDGIMLEADGTADKSKLGANAMLAVSLAAARAGATSVGLPLYRYLGGATANLLPVPMFNVLNGGAHADNDLDVQEFMLVPRGAASFAEALRWGAECFHALQAILVERGLSTAVGDEGGFAPDLPRTAAACEVLVEAVRAAGLEPGPEVALALDVAASELLGDDGYELEGDTLGAASMTEVYDGLLGDFPIISLEDPLDEDDWEGWTALMESLGDRLQIVGDDLLVTNPDRLDRAVTEEAANAILVKPNQIGTLTETMEVLRQATAAGFGTIVSHRSGETEDTTIADLAVAVGAGQIKAGAPSRGERTAKYNRLLRIEEALGESARFAGGDPYLWFAP